MYAAGTSGLRMTYLLATGFDHGAFAVRALPGPIGDVGPARGRSRPAETYRWVGMRADLIVQPVAGRSVGRGRVCLVAVTL